MVILSLTISEWMSQEYSLCKECDVTVNHKNGISICDCYLFCHKKCFIKKLEEKKFKRKFKIKCSKCQKEIYLEKKNSYEFQPHFSFLYFSLAVLFLTLFLLGSIFIIPKIRTDIDYKSEKKVILWFEFYLIFAVITLMGFILSLFELLVEKSEKILEVQSTKPLLITSAFIGLEEKTESSDTTDYIECFQRNEFTMNERK